MDLSPETETGLNNRKKLFIGLGVVGGIVAIIGIVLGINYGETIAAAITGKPVNKKPTGGGGGFFSPVAHPDPNAGILAKTSHALFQTKVGLTVTAIVCLLLVAVTAVACYFLYQMYVERAELQAQVSQLTKAVEEGGSVARFGGEHERNPFEISTMALGGVLGLILLFLLIWMVRLDSQEKLEDLQELVVDAFKFESEDD